ncbi:MAG: hypothetical protein R3C53_03985 [Pirellulaceae bacterium]
MKSPRLAPEVHDEVAARYANGSLRQRLATPTARYANGSRGVRYGLLLSWIL